MLSMTGYGKAETVAEDFRLTVEIKTVNNRNLDLSIRAPRQFLSLEDVVRKTVQAKIVRGRTDVFVNFTDLREADADFTVDESAVKAYLKLADLLSIKYDVINDLTVSKVLALPEAMKNTATCEDLDFIAEPLERTVVAACNALNAMRAIEGEKLKADFEARIATVTELVDKIKVLAPTVAKDYAEKLKVRVSELLLNVPYDENRLLTEVAVFADKSNIDEEITRLYSHISQFKKLINEIDSGKKLDFLMQEFNREANTICSKANDIEITKNALNLKAEIEKIREQVQNVE